VSKVVGSVSASAAAATASVVVFLPPVGIDIQAVMATEGDIVGTLASEGNLIAAMV
jgi:4'-phosphopantetheinyl transferase EntD